MKLDTLQEEIARGDIDGALGYLAEQKSPEERAGARLVLDSLSAWLANQLFLATIEDIHIFLDVAGVHPAYAERLVSDRRLMHLWPQGRNFGPHLLAGERAQTLCGLDLEGDRAERVPRGSWRHPELVGRDLCLPCSQHADQISETREDLDHPPLDQEGERRLEAALEGRIRNDLKAELEARPGLGLDGAQTIAKSALKEILLQESLEQVGRSGEVIFRRVFDEQYPELVADLRRQGFVGEGLAQLVSRRDWRVLLDTICPPRPDHPDWPSEGRRYRQQLSEIVRRSAR